MKRPCSGWRRAKIGDGLILGFGSQGIPLCISCSCRFATPAKHENDPSPALGHPLPRGEGCGLRSDPCPLRGERVASGASRVRGFARTFQGRARLQPCRSVTSGVTALAAETSGAKAAGKAFLRRLFWRRSRRKPEIDNPQADDRLYSKAASQGFSRRAHYG